MTTSSTKTDKDLKPLIDCDLLRYRCGFAADSQVKRDYKQEHPGCPDDEVEQHIENLDYIGLALQNVKTVMESVVDRFNPEYRAYVQGDGNFRDKIATILPYKGNRDSAHKPKYYKEIKEYLLDRWNAIEVHGQESDDAIGIEQFDNPDKYTVIVSTDKDMNTVPGWHFNWVKGELYYVTLADANRFFFHQMLEGDRTDNIPGITGVGPKTAAKIVAEHGHDLVRLRAAVQDQYKRQYGMDWEKAYWEVGNLLYIRRKPGEECPLL